MAALARTGTHNATTYATSGSTSAESSPNSRAREVTATLIWANTCRIARLCAGSARRRAAAMPLTIAPATIAAERRNPAVTTAPPLASNASTTPEGTSARRTMPPATRPRPRCQSGRRWSGRVMSAMQSGSATSAAATWTLSETSHRDSNRTVSFSSTKGGSVSRSKYERLDAVMSAAPASIDSRNDRRSHATPSLLMVRSTDGAAGGSQGRLSRPVA